MDVIDNPDTPPVEPFAAAFNFQDPPTLPEALVARGFALRGELEEDRAFMERLFISVRWGETGLTGWPEDERRSFLRQQYAAQTLHYRTHYHDAEFCVVECRGEPVGRLYLHRSPRELRVVDISLSPEFRNGGTGTALLTALQAEATARGRIVSIHVEKFNPAQTLYLRLGFVAVSENGPYWRMDWTPPNLVGATLT